MNKELKNTFTIQEKFQKILLWVFIVSLMAGPLALLRLNMEIGNTERYLFWMAGLLVEIAALWLGIRMILPVFKKPESKPEGDEEEELFL